MLGDERSIGEKGERDAGRGELRQGDPEKDHPTQHEVHADQRTDRADENAADERIVQQEARVQDLEKLAHVPAPIAPSISAIRSGASISSAGPCSARPPWTQTTERTRPRS